MKRAIIAPNYTSTLEENKTKSIHELFPRGPGTARAKVSSVAGTLPAQHAERLVAALPPSCLPSLQRLKGDKFTGLKLCHTTASRVYSRPLRRVEGPLCSRGES